MTFSMMFPLPPRLGHGAGDLVRQPGRLAQLLRDLGDLLRGVVGREHIGLRRVGSARSFLLTRTAERFGLPAHADSPVQARCGSPTAAGTMAVATATMSVLLAPGEAQRRDTPKDRRPEQRDRRARTTAQYDGRDVTPRIGRRGEPGRWRRSGRTGRRASASSREYSSDRPIGRSCTATLPEHVRRMLRKPPLGRSVVAGALAWPRADASAVHSGGGSRAGR